MVSVSRVVLVVLIRGPEMGAQLRVLFGVFGAVRANKAHQRVVAADRGRTAYGLRCLKSLE